MEGVQRRATRLVGMCRGRSYKERLSLLHLSTLEERRIRGDMILTFRIIRGLCCLNVEEFFTLSHDGRTRGHPFKLAVLRSTCEARRFSFSRRVVPLWNSLPAEVVDADSVLSFKQRYDRFIAVRAMREDANIFVTP